MYVPAVAAPFFVFRHGMPRKCERCGVDAAFPRSSSSSFEAAGDVHSAKDLCFLCSFALKKKYLVQQRSKSRVQQTLQLLHPGRVDATPLDPEQLPKGLPAVSTKDPVRSEERERKIKKKNTTKHERIEIEEHRDRLMHIIHGSDGDRLLPSQA